ncbi:MAG: sensor histidine kinase, partial [Bacteroidetes bacterium]|nr:sensor histidine kinase [Bacteroidota bacterium]
LPPSLDRLGLFFALKELANWVNKSEELRIECTKSGEQFRFESENELAIFRIVQELLNNAIKHSGADLIKLNVRFSENYLAVLLADNGKGFNMKEKMNTGLGLKNLESRTQLLKAEFRMNSKPGKGTGAFIYMQKEK